MTLRNEVLANKLAADKVYVSLHHCYMGELFNRTLGMFHLTRTIYIESVHALLEPSPNEILEWHDETDRDFFLRVYNSITGTITDYQDEFHYTSAY